MGSRQIKIVWALSLCLTLLRTTLATPLRPTYSSCLDSYSPRAPESAQLIISDVLANLVPAEEASEQGLQGNGVSVLRINLVGQTGSELVGYNNDTNKLATLFIDAKTASFNVYQSTSWICNSLFPSELPGPYIPQNTTYCPLPAGPFGVNISIPLYRSYALTTLRTQIRIVDTSETAQTLSCLDLQFTPYRKGGWYYGIFLWLPVALTIGFFVTTWGARFAAGWVVGSGVAEYEQKETALGRRAKLDTAKKEATMRKWGTMIISGLSGERLSVSGGLLRFVTPGLKEILHHVQFCAMLGMVAVSWPRFAYPILSRGAWATLVWNTTLVQGSDAESKRIIPYPSSNNYTPPAEFADQISNPDLPLYLDESAFNPLLNLYNQPRGMESFAFAVGLRPQDLFGTCLVIFLILVLAVFLISLALWASHCLLEYSTPATSNKQQQPAASISRPSLGSSPMPSYGTKTTNEPRTPSLWDTSAPPSLPAHHNVPHPPTGPSHARRIWWRFRPKGEAGAFHAAALYGNLLRLILIFHLPITILSIYQLVLGSRASIVSRVFAALAFAFITVLIPTGIMLRIKRTPSGKLFDATRTLLSLGPMYNVYVEDKQMFRAVPLGASLVAGIVVGAGQGSGLAQAVVLVLVELVLLIAPAVWYPWDDGASMGAPHTFVAALRTISMVLVMLLSPELGMTPSTAQWLAYAILLLQAIIFVFFLLMLITKAVEGFIRLFGGVHFDESTHPLDGGLFGAIADLDCLNPRGGKAAERKRRKRGSKQLQRNVSAAGSLTTQMMLDRHSMGVMRPVSDGGGGNTPFLSPDSARKSTPGLGPGNGPYSGNYFPAYTPPLGPPPMERHSSDSMTDEQHTGGNIMDAWRPYHASQSQSQGGYFESQQAQAQAQQGMYGVQTGAHGRSQSTPNAYGSIPLQSPQSPPFTSGSGSGPGPGPGPGSTGFSVVRGGRADISNPYTVQNPSRSGNYIVERDRSATISPPPSIRVSPISPKPTHSRQHSSTAIIESFDHRVSPPQTPLYPPHPHPPQGVRRQSTGLQSNHRGHNHSHGLAPPVLALTIPKRRSLNNLKEDSPTDKSESELSASAAAAAVAAKKKKRRSWFKSDTESPLGRDGDRDEDEGEDTEELESDDEPGPSRRTKAKSKSKSKSKAKPKPKPKPKGKRGSMPLKEPAPFEPVPLMLDYDPEESELQNFGSASNPDHRSGHDPNSSSSVRSRIRSRSTTRNQQGHGGLMGFLGLRRKKSLDAVAEQARDENSARKAVLAAESGAMLFGVQPQPQARSQSPLSPSNARPHPHDLGNGNGNEIGSGSGSGNGRSFKVSRIGDGTGGGKGRAGDVRGSPLSLPNRQGSVPSSSGSQPQPQPQSEPRSFKVKRLNQTVPSSSPSLSLSTAPNEFGQTASTPATAGGGESTKSFKVKRPPIPNSPHVQAPAPGTGTGNTSAASSFIVNRPTQPPPVLAAPITTPTRTPPHSPRPESPHMASNRGKASMFQSQSTSKGL